MAVYLIFSLIENLITFLKTNYSFTEKFTTPTETCIKTKITKICTTVPEL